MFFEGTLNRFLANNDQKLKEKYQSANTKNYEKYFNVLSSKCQLLTKSQIGSGRILHCCCDDNNKQRNLRGRLFLLHVLLAM